MAKFCGKCGSKLDEATGLCPKCDAEKIEQQRKEKERSERERLERERQEKEKAEKEKAEKEREEKERAEKEDKERSGKENRKDRKADKKAAKKERKVQKKAAKKEQKARNKAQKKADKKKRKQEKWAKLTFGQKLRKILLKLLLWVIFLALLAGGIFIFFVYFHFVEVPAVSKLLNSFGIVSEEDSDRTGFYCLDAGFTNVVVVDEASAISAAKDAAKTLGLDHAADELTIQSIQTVDDATYYRMQQNYNGIPVAGKIMVVIADESGNAVGFTSNAVSLENLEFGTAPDMETVYFNLAAYLNERGYNLTEQDIRVENCSDDKKAYYESDSGVLPVYILQVFWKESPLSFASITVNAKTGEIVELNTSVYEENVTVSNAAKTVLVDGYYDQASGEYQLYDYDRGIRIYSYENTDSQTENAVQTFLTSPNDVFGDTQEESALEQEKGVRLLSTVSKIRDYYCEVMNWDSYEKTYCYYNDGYDSGENALGGNASLESGEAVGYLSMGSVTGVDALDTMAHEYTHIVSRKVVDWQSIEAWSEAANEPGAINEGYSDIFGEILQSYLTKSDPDWIHGDRIISNPSSGNYPAAVGEKKFEKFQSADGTKWGMSTGGGHFTDYSHGFSTIISHCAYLMNNGVNGSCKPLDLYSLGKLWYHTLQTLPPNCTFVVLRENMELTAEILGFTEAQKQCVSLAYDEVGILKQEEGEETYAEESTLLILDKNGEIYTDCTVLISGNKFRGIFKTGLWKEEYSQEIQVSDTNPITLNLPKGDYTITVTDQANEALTSQKQIKVRSNGKLTEILIATNFGGDTVIQLPVRTTSDERDIVLVLDVSGSMSGTPMEETKKASVNFIDTILDEDASIGVVTYDESAAMLSDFSVNKTALTTAVSDIYDGGGTNIESGLAQARSMLNASSAKKKIIVLMSDGEPNEGKEGDELVAYADEIKNEDIMIYTLGFFESLGSYKSSAQILMERIASDGCHYEVADADDLIFFFEDMADQINGQKYIYIRIACPVDVTVTYNGENLCSAEENLNLRTDFGTLTFEENENAADVDDDRIKVLRLKEGAEYEVQIVGTGHGIMNYTIGFMDENGDYSDFRRFEDIKITRRTTIDTVAAAAKESVLKIDEDGDGRYDLKLRAGENGFGEEVKNYGLFLAAAGGVLVILSGVILVIRKSRKKKKESN
ncbi:MAG: VWA domain-containing protein [Fusicatenibacter sp.]|nr:VWA domain-containing protein [Lachnospiraceae bacterium]MDY2939071.1 VWA domain-containing protein [Fusicatenibacter sp.]